MKNRPLLLGATTLAVAFPVIAIASPVDIPNAFDDGDPIVAEEFNENFDAIADAINDNDARIAALEAAVGGAIPSGQVAFFAVLDENTGGCPLGWNELEEARGRAIVGVPSTAGELLGTVGSALTDLEDRTHAHNVAIGSTDPATVPHTHNLGGSTQLAGAHSHQWWDNASTWNSDGALVNPTGNFFQAAFPGTLLYSTAGQDLYTDDVVAHAHPLPTSTGGVSAATSTSHVHPIDATNTSTVNTSSIVPYVQLLACVKQ